MFLGEVIGVWLLTPRRAGDVLFRVGCCAAGFFFNIVWGGGWCGAEFVVVVVVSFDAALAFQPNEPQDVRHVSVQFKIPTPRNVIVVVVDVFVVVGFDAVVAVAVGGCSRSVFTHGCDGTAYWGWEHQQKTARREVGDVVE